MLTPISLDRLQHELHHHPNPDKVAYVVQGLQCSFHLSLNHSITFKSASGNMSSVHLNTQVIDNYLQSKVQMGRVAGPFPQPPLPSHRVSCFGIIPKHNQSYKLHLILDLSSPAGHSVNDGIASND